MQVLKAKIPLLRLAGYSFNTDANPTEVNPLVTASIVSAGAGVNTFEPANAPVPTYDTSPVLRVTPVAASTSLAAAITNNTYVEFTITAVSTQFIPRCLVFNASKGGGSSPRGYGVRSDYDSYAANLDAADLTTVRPIWTPVHIPLIMDPVSSLAFRIYYYTTGTGASIEFDDIILMGVI